MSKRIGKSFFIGNPVKIPSPRRVLLWSMGDW
jgi:hypothetical protein